MTGQEILAALFDCDDVRSPLDYSQFAYGNYSSEDWGVGPFIEIEQKGGEGEGDDWMAVFHFTEHDVFIRIDGYYASYDGTYFDSKPYEVTKQERTITVYQ